MTTLVPVSIGSPAALTVAALIGLAAIIVTVRRRPRHFAALFTAGTVLLVLAAGDVRWLAPAERQVTVMVDLSPSTRGAGFRQLDLLRNRVAQLLGQTQSKVIFFSDRNTDGALDGSLSLDEMPCEQTVFSPPSTDAVLLFSDGRFSVPAHAPPVYPVLDPSLEKAQDAAITSMRYIGDQLAVAVSNNGSPRAVTLHGVLGEATELARGNQVIARPVDPAATRIWAELSPGDNWPENDSMSIPPPPPLPTQRWWVGSAAHDGWRTFAPGSLPADAGEYLSASVIALNNVSAADLPQEAQERLEQYVRDLGGSLLILGGDKSFSAGGYQGTILESLSPLSSSPPSPRTQWIILADASGSMATVEPGGGTRWGRLTQAMVRVLPFLPPADSLRIGQFSDTLRWWSEGKTALQTAKLPLPPRDALPHGPTNLQPVLEALAAAKSDRPTELILLTDADVVIDDPESLARRLSGAQIRLHLLAIDRGSGLAELEDIVRDTGGSFITERNQSGWGDSVRRLVTAALPTSVSRQPVAVEYIGPAHAVPGETAEPWIATWIKPQATPLAVGDGNTLAATWRFGAGQVLSIAFSPSDAQMAALADLVAQPPRDPRLRVSWTTAATLRVTVDAVDGQRYLNNLDLTLEIWKPGGVSRRAIPQTAPGLYEVSVAGSAGPAIATVSQGGRIIDRTALAGDYAPEFSAVGEDRAALEQLAQSTGGRVIPPEEATAIQFGWAPQAHPLAPWLAAGGAACLAGGLVIGRFRANYGRSLKTI